MSFSKNYINDKDNTEEVTLSGKKGLILDEPLERSSIL